jgi:ATP-dependent helicase/nuclease subunit A
LIEPDVEAILVRHGVDKAVAARDVLGQIATIHSWLKARWPNATMSVEIPITHRLPTYQISSGRIDLLLETDRGWVLIDHKSGGQNSSQWESLAADYAGQLVAYSTAIETCTGKPVTESWLLLPVSGAAIRVAGQIL